MTSKGSLIHSSVSAEIKSGYKSESKLSVIGEEKSLFKSTYGFSESDSSTEDEKDSEASHLILSPVPGKRKYLSKSKDNHSESESSTVDEKESEVPYLIHSPVAGREESLCKSTNIYSESERSIGNEKEHDTTLIHSTPTCIQESPCKYQKSSSKKSDNSREGQQESDTLHLTSDMSEQGSIVCSTLTDNAVIENYPSTETDRLRCNNEENGIRANKEKSPDKFKKKSLECDDSRVDQEATIECTKKTPKSTPSSTPKCNRTDENIETNEIICKKYEFNIMDGKKKSLHKFKNSPSASQISRENEKALLSTHHTSDKMANVFENYPESSPLKHNKFQPVSNNSQMHECKVQTQNYSSPNLEPDQFKCKNEGNDSIGAGEENSPDKSQIQPSVFDKPVGDQEASIVHTQKISEPPNVPEIDSEYDPFIRSRLTQNSSAPKCKIQTAAETHKSTGTSESINNKYQISIMDSKKESHRKSEKSHRKSKTLKKEKKEFVATYQIPDRMTCVSENNPKCTPFIHNPIQPLSNNLALPKCEEQALTQSDLGTERNDETKLKSDGNCDRVVKKNSVSLKQEMEDKALRKTRSFLKRLNLNTLDQFNGFCNALDALNRNKKKIKLKSENRQSLVKKNTSLCTAEGLAALNIASNSSIKNGPLINHTEMDSKLKRKRRNCHKPENSTKRMKFKTENHAQPQNIPLLICSKPDTCQTTDHISKSHKTDSPLKSQFSSRENIAASEIMSPIDITSNIEMTVVSFSKNDTVADVEQADFSSQNDILFIDTKSLPKLTDIMPNHSGIIASQNTCGSENNPKCTPFIHNPIQPFSNNPALPKCEEQALTQSDLGSERNDQTKLKSEMVAIVTPDTARLSPEKEIVVISAPGQPCVIDLRKRNFTPSTRIKIVNNSSSSYDFNSSTKSLSNQRSSFVTKTRKPCHNKDNQSNANPLGDLKPSNMSVMRQDIMEVKSPCQTSENKSKTAISRFKAESNSQPFPSQGSTCDKDTIREVIEEVIQNQMKLKKRQDEKSKEKITASKTKFPKVKLKKAMKDNKNKTPEFPCEYCKIIFFSYDELDDHNQSFHSSGSLYF